jgi:tetratricopeptide (TPR) repeat protein
MDCLRASSVFCALCVGLAGCSSSSKWIAGKGDIGDDEVGKNSKDVAGVLSGKGKVKPETCVAMADVRVHMALDPSRTPAEREQLSEQARQFYQKAIELDSKCVPAHKGLVRLYVNLGDKERAQTAFHKALTLAPKDAGLWYDLGIYQARLRDWPASVESLHAAVQLDPDNRIYCKTLGFTLARAGQAEEGYAWLAKAMPEAQARLNLARMLYQTHQDQACADQLVLALRADPQSGEARQMLEAMQRGEPPMPYPTAGVRQAAYDPATMQPAAGGIDPAAYAAPAPEAMARTQPIGADAMPRLTRPPAAAPAEQPALEEMPVTPVLTADWDNRPAPMPKLVPQ